TRMQMQAHGAVITRRGLVTAGAEISGLEEPDPREGRPEMLNGRIRAALEQAVQRLVMVQQQTDLCGKGRTFCAFFKRPLGHFSGRDVACDGFHTGYLSFCQAQAHVLSEPDLFPTLREGRKFVVGAGNLSRELLSVELL